jgi:hypothetical protein
LESICIPSVSSTSGSTSTCSSGLSSVDSAVLAGTAREAFEVDAEAAAAAALVEVERDLGTEGMMTSVLLILDTRALKVGLSDGFALPKRDEVGVEVDDKTGPKSVLVEVESTDDDVVDDDGEEEAGAPRSVDDRATRVVEPVKSIS